MAKSFLDRAFEWFNPEPKPPAAPSKESNQSALRRAWLRDVEDMKAFGVLPGEDTPAAPSETQEPSISVDWDKISADRVRWVDGLPGEQLELDLEGVGMKEPEDEEDGSTEEDHIKDWMEAPLRLDRDEARCFVALQKAYSELYGREISDNALVTIVLRSGLQALDHELVYVAGIEEVVTMAEALVARREPDFDPEDPPSGQGAAASSV